MSYGREWNFPELGPNEVYVDFRVARSLGVGAGDVIYVRIPSLTFAPLFVLPQAVDIWWTARVAHVLSSPLGKSAYTDTDPLVFAEYKHFIPSLAAQLEQVFDVSHFQDASLYEYAQRVCTFGAKSTHD